MENNYFIVRGDKWENGIFNVLIDNPYIPIKCKIVGDKVIFINK